MIRNVSVRDDRAISLVRTNLEVCSYDGRLSRLLLPRIDQEPRSITAVVGKWVDTDSLKSYEIGAPPSWTSKDPFKDELVVFVHSFLASDDRAFLLCQAGSSAMKVLAIWDWSVPPRHFCVNEHEVYYALKSSDRDLKRIDATLGDSLRSPFGAVICTRLSEDRLQMELDESIIDEAAANAEHLIVPAFDGDGYLIWSFAEVRE